MKSIREEGRGGGEDERVADEDVKTDEALAQVSAASLMAAAAVPPRRPPHHNSDEDDDDDDAGSRTEAPLVRRARRLLFRRLRVGVEDGRVFVGKFHCLDKQGNIILYDTTEFRPTSPPPLSAAVPAAARADDSEAAAEQRNLGLVLIPARRRTSLFVESSLHEQFSLLSV